MRRLFKGGAVILSAYCKQCCIILLPSAAFNRVNTLGVSELLFEAGREGNALISLPLSLKLFKQSSSPEGIRETFNENFKFTRICIENHSTVAG